MGQIFLTIVSGVTIYILGQIILKMFVEPVANFKKIIANVHFTMAKFANVIHNSDAAQEEILKEVVLELRSQSGYIYSGLSVIPLYDFTSRVFNLPSEEKLHEAARNLIALGNWMRYPRDFQKTGYIFKNSQELYENLNLRLPEESKLSKETIEKLTKINNA